MIKILTDYDYEPRDPVDYVTLIIYYLSLSEEVNPRKFLGLFGSIILGLCSYKYLYYILGLSHFSCFR